MTWADFYLVCFLVGFALSLISFLSGGLHGHFHFPHLPHGHGTFGHVGHAPVAGHPPAGPHAGGPNGAAQGGGQGENAAPAGQISPFNFITLTAFLAWFGGTGYLLTRFSAFWVGTALLLAIVAGLIGGAIIFLFLTKVLMSDQEYLDAADFEMVGVLGKLSVPIREGGTGELIYSQMGTRRVCGARSEDGSAIPKGTEVVVTRYEKGIAYVQLWSEIAGDLDASSAETTRE